MKQFYQFSLFLFILLIAGCRPDTVRPFNQQTATQVQKFGDDMVASSVQFLKGFPVDIAGATVYLQSALPVPPIPSSGAASSLRPQAGSDCGLPIGDPMRLDADSDGIQANYNYTFNCSSATYRGFPALLTGNVKISDQSDNDPTSGYDVNITNLKLEYTNSEGKAESISSSQTTKLLKLVSGDYSVNQDFSFASFVNGLTTGYTRKGVLTYAPLGTTDRFARGVLNGTTDFSFTENSETRNYKLVTQNLRVDQNACGRDLAVNAGALRFEYATGDTLTWTLQDTNGDGNACGEGIWTFNAVVLPTAEALSAPLQFGNGSDNLAAGVATDASSNTYFVFTSYNGFEDTTGSNSLDAVLVKLNVAGVKQWSRVIATPFEDVAAGVAVGANGDVYVAGTTAGSFPGFSNGADKDGFLAFFDSSGVSKGLKQFGGLRDQVVSGLAADKTTGDIVVVASSLTVAGDKDVLLGRFAANGDEKWLQQLVSSGDETPKAVAISACSCGIYVTGSLSGVLQANTSFGGIDLFLLKYDDFGVLQWSRQYGTGFNDFADAVAVATDSSGIYLTGLTYGTFATQTSAGGADVLLMRFDILGTKQWLKQFGTADYDAGHALYADDTHVYLAGTTASGLDGNTNAGFKDVFVAKFAADSSKLWTKQRGSDQIDIPFGMALSKSNYLLIIGQTDGTFTSSLSFGQTDTFLLPIAKTP
jgi:hypothetical protein